MLFLVFQPGEHRYALDASQVVEVLPLVSVHEIARAPGEVAGLFIYRGAPVPVIDLSQLLEGRPAAQRLSTRVVIAQYPSGSGGRLVGLIAERATETIRREIADFVDSGLVNEGAPYLGPITSDSRGLVQRVDITKILPPSHEELPPAPSEEHAWRSPTSKTC